MSQMHKFDSRRLSVWPSLRWRLTLYGAHSGLLLEWLAAALEHWATRVWASFRMLAATLRLRSPATPLAIAWLPTHWRWLMLIAADVAFAAHLMPTPVTHCMVQHVYHRAVRRRRRRPNVGVAPAPFSWRVHVMLYTSCMLLAFCNVVYNEAWTLTERTTRACSAIALDTQTKHGGVKAKVFLWTVLWKWKLMLKVSYGTSLVIGLIKRMVQWKISTACTVITAYKVAKLKRTKTLSAWRICHNIFNVW